MKTKFTITLLCILINTLAIEIGKAQYVDDFEGANNGWSISAIGSTSSLWQLGLPNYGLTTGAHSGTHAWDVELDTAYKNASYAFLYSPVFDFSNAVDATLSFWRNNDCEPNWDGARMDYTTDSGITWNVLGAVGSGINWYNHPSIISSNLPAWSGTTSGWVQSSLVLSMFNNLTSPVQFRFVFNSDFSVVYDGFSIDDFSIDQVPPPTPGPAFNVNCFTTQSAPCTGNYTGYFSIYGTALGTNNGDTLNVNINYGNGHDSSFTVMANNGCFFTNLNYDYNSIGQYSIQIIINQPGGIADTLTQYNVIIFASCGNLQGTVYNDANGNCVFDSTEVPLKNYPLKIYKNGVFYQNVYSDVIGNYGLMVPSGSTYIIEADTTNINGFNSICPSSLMYSITTIPSDSNDFALSCNPGFDLFGSLGIGGSAPGFNSFVSIHCGNLRCIPVNATVSLIMPPGVSYFSGPAGAIVSGDTVSWNISNLSVLSATSMWGSSFYATVHLDTTLHIGDTICYKLIINPVNGDLDSSNNYVFNCREVTGSFDPNEKIVEPAGTASSGNVAPNTTFTYTVNFQNTGTAVAHNITIVDTLDADLDPATLQILSSTHPMNIVFLPGNILHFNFYNIMLPDSNANEALSHGGLQYTIAARNNLIQGTQIDNTAYIYFDFNAVVVTNTTINTIDYTLSLAEHSNSNSFIIYPQPAADYINLKFEKSAGGLLQIVDARGKLCRQLQVTGNSTVSTAGLAGGVYYIIIQTETSTLRNKLVIIK